MVSRIVLLINNDRDGDSRIVTHAVDLWGHVSVPYSSFRPALDAIEEGMRYDVLLTDLDLGMDVRHLPSGVTQASSFSSQFESGTRIIQASREHQPDAPAIVWSYATSIAIPIADGVWNLRSRGGVATRGLLPLPTPLRGAPEWQSALEDRLLLDQQLREDWWMEASDTRCLFGDSAIENLELLRQYLALPSYSVKRMPAALRPIERPKSFLGRLFSRRDGD